MKNFEDSKTRTILEAILIAVLFSSLIFGKVFGQETKNPLITGSISTGIFSHYVAPVGYILGKGPHNQNYLDLNAGGFKLFGWSDYDFADKSMIEFDLGMFYSKKIKNTSLTAGFTYWNYPSGGDDKIAYIILGHEKNITKEVSFGQLIKDKENENGFWIKPKISKKFNHKNGFSSEGGINAAYLFNFYGDTGLAHITPGASVNWNKGNLNLTGALNYQFGFINETVSLPPIKNQLYGSLNLSVSF
jgi:hypothetical protein